MADFDALAFVTAAAPVLGLDLPAERLAEIAAVFAQVQRFATPALATTVPQGDEPPP